MTNKALSVVILAAGKGTRMYSDLPKVLHKVAGKPMVKHVIDTANQLGAENVHLIYGHGGELMRERLANESVNWVIQAEQLGTAHAVQQAAPFFKDDENIVILYGDAPLVTKETLEKLIAAKPVFTSWIFNCSALASFCSMIATTLPFSRIIRP